MVLDNSGGIPLIRCGSMPLLWDSVSKILFNFSTLARSSALQFSHLFNTMDSQSQNTSLQRLQNVEKRIVTVLELAGGVMDEMANPSGPRKELIDSHCSEFMQLIKDIQVTLREEIKSACEYRPFEKCDYVPRISNEICCKKLEYVISQFDDMKRTIEGYHAASLDNMALD